MPHRIASWLRDRTRRATRALRAESPPAPASSSASGDLDPARRSRARVLAIAIEDAIIRRESARARRLASQTELLLPHSLRLREAVARVHASGGRFGEAVSLLCSAPLRTQSSTLLLVACLLRQGRRREAHAQLRMLCQNDATAPSEARILLAHLEHDLGDNHAAVESLLRDLRHGESPRTIEQLVLLSAIEGRLDAARRYAARLEHAVGFRTSAGRIAHLLGSLSIRPAIELVPAPQEMNQLAMEITVREEVIPALVAAQEIRPARSMVALLRRALEQALPDLDARTLAMEGLARLCRIEGHPAAALGWIDAALAIDPHRHVLHQLRQELISRDGTSLAAPDDDSSGIVGVIAPDDHQQRGQAA